MVVHEPSLSLIGAIKPGKIYSTSIQKVARRFWILGKDALVRDLAEEFRHRPDIPVVAVLVSLVWGMHRMLDFGMDPPF